MTLLTLENLRTKSKICELFGLSKSGKSTYSRKLISKGYLCCVPYEGGYLRKFALFMRFFIKNPINFLMMFYKLNSNWIILDNLDLIKYIKILKMRNSYLLAVLARHEDIANIKKEIYADEFFLQSLFMIFQTKTNKFEISRMIDMFPKSQKVLLIDINRKIRYERLNKIGFPGQKIDDKYARIWMENSEFNYKVIKEILMNKYRIIKNICHV